MILTSSYPVPLIAVVDDDISIRRSVSRLIRAFGYDVESHESAEAYLVAERSPAPDCLILDVHMPGLSGLELHQQLRETGDQTAVVFITAHADSSTRERALEGGAIALLAKPFSDEVLQASVARGIEETLAQRS